MQVLKMFLLLRHPTLGLEVRVAFGSVWKESLTELSGGQRSLLALSLVLALCRCDAGGLRAGEGGLDLHTSRATRLDPVIGPPRTYWESPCDVQTQSVQLLIAQCRALPPAHAAGTSVMLQVQAGAHLHPR